MLVPTGRLDEAIAAAKKVLQSDPLNSSYWRRLSLVQWGRHDYRAAIEAANRSLDLSPQQSNTAAFVGYCLLLQHQPRGSPARFRSAPPRPHSACKRRRWQNTSLATRPSPSGC